MTHNIMSLKKRIFLVLIIAAAVFLFSGCSDLFAPTEYTSIIPTTFAGRTTEDLGTIYVTNRSLTIEVWDHGQIDGDIVTIYVNGSVVMSYELLDGPSNPASVTVQLDNNGYNYVLLYAENEGSISPNTCTIALDDGSTIENFVLSSNLTTNGAVNVFVE